MAVIILPSAQADLLWLQDYMLDQNYHGSICVWGKQGRWPFSWRPRRESLYGMSARPYR